MEGLLPMEFIRNRETYVETDIFDNLREAINADNPITLMPYVEKHFNMLKVEENGDWNYSAYDMAWVLCCDFFTDEAREILLDDLIARQSPEGIWGHGEYAPHSALIDTLGTVYALVRLGRDIPRYEALQAAVDPIILGCIDYNRHELVAFEILAPKLMRWLAERGVEFPLSERSQNYILKAEAKADMKIGYLRSKGLFKSGVPISFSAEFLALTGYVGDELEQLVESVRPNGAVGLSPAATAATIIMLREAGLEVPQSLYDYLDMSFRDYAEKAFPNAHPLTNTRRLWNMLPWLVSGNIFNLIQDRTVLNFVKQIYTEINWDEQGRVSWDVNNTDVPDLDDTAVAVALYKVMYLAGITDVNPLSADSLIHFRERDERNNPNKGKFFCYPMELSTSPSAVLHANLALDYSVAVRDMGTTREEMLVIEEALGMIFHQIDPQENTIDALCHDKWCLTWTYCAQRWVSSPTLRFAYPKTVKALALEMLERQHEDGGWGHSVSTLEETSYVISGLCTMLKARDIKFSREEILAFFAAIDRGYQFIKVRLLDRDTPLDIPPLWICKTLYRPRYQIVSGIMDGIYSVLTLKFFIHYSQHKGRTLTELGKIW